MQVQVNTDNHIEGRQALSDRAEAVVGAALERFADRVTRVEVHLGDENSRKGGEDDKKCVLEARPGGMQPLVVSHHAATIDQALDGATEKLERLLESTFDKLGQKKGRTSMGGDQTI